MVPFELSLPALTVAVLAGLGWLGYDYLTQRPWRHETGSAYGDARWATVRDLSNAGLLGSDGIIIGRHRGKLLRTKTEKHLLTLAPNRSGKGVSSIVPNLLTWPGSLIVVDPKGENAVVTARRRREMGQAVHVLDPWGITGLPQSRFNPLLWLDPDGSDLVEDASLIADALIVTAGPNGDEFWSNEAKALVCGLLMHIATTEPAERRTLAKLRHCLTLNGDAFDWLIDEMARNETAAFGLVARAASRLQQKSDRERTSVISAAQAETHFLDSPRMDDVMARSDFDLADFKRGGVTVYLVLPAERLATHGRWLRLMIASALASLTGGRPSSRPVLFVLDEFAALGRLDAIETALGLLAGYGVQLWPILQDLSQLEDLYPKRWRSFLANAGVVQAFGVNDVGTAKYLSSLLGTRTVMVRQQGRASDQRRGVSESLTAASRALLLPQEILRLRSDQQLVLAQGEPPLLAEKLRYYADAEFAGLYDANPMHYVGAPTTG